MATYAYMDGGNSGGNSSVSLVNAILGWIDRSVDTNREQLDRTAFNKWAASGYQGDMPDMMSRWGRGARDQWTGEQFANSLRNRDVQATESWSNFNEGMQKAAGQSVPVSPFATWQFPQGIQTPFPAMAGSDLGRAMQNSYGMAQVSPFMPMGPKERAEIGLLNAQSDYYSGRAMAEMNPVLTGSDFTETVLMGPDNQYHVYRVNKLTGVKQDLGLASPKDTGLPDPLQAQKIQEETESIRGQNKFYDATRPYNVEQARYTTERMKQEQQMLPLTREAAELENKQKRLSLLEAQRNLDGRLSPALERQAAQLKLDLAKQQVVLGQADVDLQPLKKQLLEAQIAETRAKAAGTTDKVSQANTLRGEFNANPVVKRYATIQYGASLLQKAYQESLSADTLNAADMTIGTVFQKILDPESVVRESEFARTTLGQSALDQIRGKVDQIAIGGIGLTQKTREALLRIAKEALDVSKSQVNEHMDRYGQLADEFNVPRPWVFGGVKPFGGSSAATVQTNVSPSLPSATSPAAQPIAISPYIDMARSKGATDQDIANLQIILQSGDQERIRKALSRIQGP